MANLKVRQEYRDRLLIPENPTELEKNSIMFFVFDCGSWDIVAPSYQRVVIGDRGPYVEFSSDDIYQRNLYIPPDQKWRTSSKICYYIEYRTIASSYVKVYYQKKLVKYADYKLGMWYISPFDMRVTYFDNKDGISEIKKLIKEK